MARKYREQSVWQALIANANAGGENVHRAALLGAVLGTAYGESNLPDHLKTGLYDYSAIVKEIEQFINALDNLRRVEDERKI
mmetsp:Transcript_17499/g.22814  ORF Transcript_17499/g.22814 Transcript_17499/m.22814 type:complete len:82 (+) Transcript_17499:927-1172(+)